MMILFGLTSGLSRVRGNTALTNGTKYMIGSTADGTGGTAGILHYLNGVAESLTTVTNTLVGAGARTADFAIGAHITGGSTYGERLNANGLGFLAVFNAVLTAREMRLYAHLAGFL